MPPRYRVEITASAERDVEAIREYIEADNPSAARKWVAKLVLRMRSLDRFPLRNPVIPEARLLGVEYRHAIVGSYRMIYRVQGDLVIVVRIVHGAQLLQLPSGESGP